MSRVKLLAGDNTWKMYNNVQKVAFNVRRAKKSADPAMRAMGEDAVSFYSIVEKNTPKKHPLSAILNKFVKIMGRK